MGLAEEIARVRMKARGADINARHRRSQEKVRKLQASQAPVTPPDGVAPDFARQLDLARARAKKAADAQARGQATPTERIDELVRQGRLPPREHAGVGYEPTPEEILGETGEAVAPGGTEELPDAESVLSGASPEAEDGALGVWGDPPPPAQPGGAEAPSRAPTSAPRLAPPAPAVQAKRKRGK
jgi:hypothetical protein